MKYVKISQDQLDQIQSLLDAKDKRVEALQSEIRICNAQLESSGYNMMAKQLYIGREVIDTMQKDRCKMVQEAENFEAQIEKYQNTIRNLESALEVGSRDSDQMFERVSRLECELSLQKSVNKAAVKHLNELNKTGSTLESADLSRILDKRA